MPPCSGAGGGSLPPPTALPAVWRSAAPQRSALSALGVAVRYDRGPCATLHPMPVRGNLSSHTQPDRRDHARPMHARIRAGRRQDGGAIALSPARTLLSEFLPLDTLQTVETTRQRTLRVGARLEQEAVAGAGSKSAEAAKTIALSIDGGHVRAARQYQGRSFEVLLAQVGNDEGKQVVFSSVPAVALRLTGSSSICVGRFQSAWNSDGSSGSIWAPINSTPGGSSDAPSEGVEALCKARPRRRARLPAPWKKCSEPLGPPRRRQRDST
jgi:hypothetical protein